MSARAGDGPHGLLEVGRIAKPHGLHGEVIVELITDRTERIAVGSVLWTRDRQLEILASQPHQHRWLVHFAGIDDRRSADALHGLPLFAEPIDDPDALWIHELIGCTVRDVDGTERGTVESVLANPASDLLVLDSGALVPLVFVVEGPAEGRLVIDPPAGLFGEDGPESV